MSGLLPIRMESAHGWRLHHHDTTFMLWEPNDENQGQPKDHWSAAIVGVESCNSDFRQSPTLMDALVTFDGWPEVRSAFHAITQPE